MEIVKNEESEVQGIKLDKKYFDDTKIGKRVSLSRKGVMDYRVGNAFFVNPENEEDRFKVVINTVFLCTFEDLLKEKSQYVLEGHDSKRELMDDLYGKHGKIENSDIMTVIFFSYRQVGA